LATVAERWNSFPLSRPRGILSAPGAPVATGMWGGRGAGYVAGEGLHRRMILDRVAPKISSQPGNDVSVIALDLKIPSVAY
jgi:hypothetical protein